MIWYDFYEQILFGNRYFKNSRTLTIIIDRVIADELAFFKERMQFGKHMEINNKDICISSLGSLLKNLDNYYEDKIIYNSICEESKL